MPTISMADVHKASAAEGQSGVAKDGPMSPTSPTSPTAPGDFPDGPSGIVCVLELANPSKPLTW